MHIEAHATLGWLIANVGNSDQRLANYCVLAAVSPDIDAVSYLFGIETYSKYHHTFGHNIFFGLLLVAFISWRCRSAKATLLSTLCFASHLLSDAYFTRWELYLFWPLSDWACSIPNGVGLIAPINTWLVYLALPALVVIALIYRRTPLAIISPQLDRHFLALFQTKPLHCGICGRKCNHHCCKCEQPLCWHHGILQTDFQVYCRNCLSPNGASND